MRKFVLAAVLVLMAGGGDRTYKLCSDTTSEYGRYVKFLGEPCRGAELRARLGAGH